MEAVIYLRVSTDEQADSGAGLAAQEDACRAWCAANGATVGAVHTDAGISGGASLEKRPGLLAALADLGKGSALVVAKRDRVARDVLVSAMVEAAADRSGARVVSAAGEGTEDDGPTGLLMRRIVDAFAEYERAVISTRTRSALAAKKARGERVGHVPYGQRDGGDGRLVPDPLEQEMLTVIGELRADGVTWRAIADRLGARGTRHGRRWTSSALHRCAAGRV
jgi:site-specific DNA recombinase